MTDLRLPRARPPCSVGERNAARIVAQALVALGLGPRLEPFQTATSPTWVPLLRAAARLAAGVLVILGQPAAGLGAAAVSVVPGLRLVVRSLPGLSGTSQNVVTHIPGRGDPVHPPLVVVTHVDAHPTAGAPLVAPHRIVAGLSGWGILAVTARLVLGGQNGWQVAAMIVAVEALLTLALLSGRELGSRSSSRDNDSALGALVRTAELVAEEPPVRDVWLVATGAATAGGSGIRAFLGAHRDVARVAWVIEVDALGDGELVVSPARRRFPHLKTPPAVVRAVAGAALDTGDALDVRRIPRAHDDARAALVTGSPALTITGGARSPLPASGEADPANAERAARIVDRLARTTL